tara:strand:- start:3032 stop:3355 length:324 start_codon:yes stop_codon:yes gene_type:complete
MNVSEMQIGLDVLIGVLSAAAGALTIWYTLKNKVQIQQLLIDQNIADVGEIKSNSKTACDMLHKRVDDLKLVVEKNREKNDNSISTIKAEMNAMEIRIIQAIHDIKK